MIKQRKKVLVLLFLALLLAILPLWLNKGAGFGGTDDAGSQMISQIQGQEYQPWFSPIIENWLGGEVPGEVESLLFCLQTGIGVGIIAFYMGRFVERKKHRE